MVFISIGVGAGRKKIINVNTVAYIGKFRVCQIRYFIIRTDDKDSKEKEKIQIACCKNVAVLGETQKWLQPIQTEF
jgi:hypothetical protein